MRRLAFILLGLALAPHMGWAANQLRELPPSGNSQLSVPQAERRAVLLPLQDRVGDAQLALQVTIAFRQALSKIAFLKDPALVRDTMRAVRARNVRDISPALLEDLFARLNAEWLFAPTLHATSSGLVPTVILSAQVFRAGEEEIAWAGFRSSSGLERRQVLGRGVEIELEQVMRRAVHDLVEDFTRESLIRGELICRLTRKPHKPGFRRRQLNPQDLGRVAVVPFDAVTGAQSAVHAEMITALATAELYRHGVRVAIPTIVSETLRQRRNLLPGELGPIPRIALLIVGDVEHIFTGTVEVFDSQGGIEPKPEVEFGARLMTAETGQILWMDGFHEDGWDRKRLFLTRRIFAGGRLAESMMHAMVTGALVQDPTSSQDTHPPVAQLKGSQP